MTILNRRELFGATLATGAALRAPGWMLAGEPARALVVVQLRGGNDGLNTLVPFQDDAYWRARPALALDRAALLPVDDLNAFHPKLVRTARRFDRGQVAVLQNVGYANPNLSHFRSMDIWDSATPDGPLPPTGWIGNFYDAHVPGGTGPISMLALGCDAMPRALFARSGVAAAVPDLESYRIQASGRDARARRKALAAMHRGLSGERLGHVAETLAAAKLSIAELQRVEAVQNKAAYPGSKLGRDLSLAARVLGSGMNTRFLFVSQGGYDTHTTQLRDHARLLRELDTALDAFLTDLENQGQLERTLVMTISEFGRRVQESGIGASAGTDHGAASMSLLFGSGVRGGVHGGQPDLAQLDENGNLVHRHDFRSLYATAVEDWMGGDAERVLGRRWDKLEVLA